MTDKVAVIFGGARGIGYASALRIAADCSAISLVDINGERAKAAAKALQEATGTRAMGYASDIGKLDDVKSVRNDIVKELGHPSVLVNCAAIVDDKLFLDSSPEDWNRMFSVCLYGTMHVLHEFLPSMVEAKYGRVVCLASDSAKTGQARLSYYAAAKGAVVALAKSIAQELGRSSVTVNIVSPGATNTEMRNEREENLLAAMGPEKYERRKQAVLKAYPLGRLGEPDDIAAAVHFLTTDDASWITGQVLSVNGGYMMS